MNVNGESIKFAYFPGTLRKIEDYMFTQRLLNVEVIYFGDGFEEIASCFRDDNIDT